MKVFRRTVSLLAALTLVFGNCAQALADTYDLAEGSISINADSTGQSVTQNSVTQQDNNVTVTSNGVTTSNSISVSSTDGATASFTVENLSVKTSGTGSAVDIADGSSVEITVSGENDLAATHYNTACVIHVADADLTITGDGDDSTNDVLTLSKRDNVFGAVIGSLSEEDFNGNLVIEDVKIDANSGASFFDSAVIGSGEYNDFNGTVTIRNAEVIADGYYSTGIGGGFGGKMTGEILIEDSKVTAINGYSGTGIGSGYGDDLTGTITIRDSEVITEAGYMGVGIGAGSSGAFTGSIEISDSTVTATVKTSSTGIGSGYHSEYSGSLEIENSQVTVSGGDRSTGIGASYTSEFTEDGSVAIRDSDVTLNTTLGIGTGEYWNYYDYGGMFAGDITMTGDTNIYANTANQDVILGTPVPESETGVGLGTVTIDTSMTLHKADGTQLQGEALESVIHGAELVILSEPKAASDSSRPKTDDFWYGVAARIRSSQPGETVTAKAAHRTVMPAFVMDAIRECGVTLVIQWNGGDDITIEKAYDGDKLYKVFPLKDLAALLAG